MKVLNPIEDISNESSIQSNKNSDLSSDYLDERRLPLPGGIKEQEEKINSEENIFKEEIYLETNADLIDYDLLNNFLDKLL